MCIDENEYWESGCFEALGCKWIAFHQVRNGKLGFTLQVKNMNDPALFKGLISFKFDLCSPGSERITQTIPLSGVFYGEELALGNLVYIITPCLHM